MILFHLLDDYFDDDDLLDDYNDDCLANEYFEGQYTLMIYIVDNHLDDDHIDDDHLADEYLYND